MSVSAISFVARIEPLAELRDRGRLQTSVEPNPIQPLAFVPPLTRTAIVPPSPMAPDPAARPDPSTEETRRLRQDGQSLNDTMSRQVAWHARPDPWVLRSYRDLRARYATAADPASATQQEPSDQGILHRLVRLMVETYGKLFSPPLGRLVDIQA